MHLREKANLRQKHSNMALKHWTTWVSKDLSTDIMDSGYCQYDLIINSDHRGSFVNLEGRDTEELLGKRSPRLLSSKNLKNRARYLQTLRELMEEHNVFERSRRLSEAEEMNEELIQELQETDRIMTSCMITAEDRLHVDRTGDHFSKKIHILKSKMRYWRILNRKNSRLPDKAKLMLLNAEYSDEHLRWSRRRRKTIMGEIGDEIEK